MRQKALNENHRYKKVSIHASVKDATVTTVNTAIVDEVSIHASVKDATSDHLALTALVEFQSTHL